MPGYDRKGPEGKGSRTGGGHGLCKGAAITSDGGPSEQGCPMNGSGRSSRSRGDARGRCCGTKRRRNRRCHSSEATGGNG